ncbi:hypothetical protein HanRHA438_Chr13g0593501 [Helianthus annuus]|nr:hypothetical protein HanRHA438_Chr13g0593501 [Helianthus annuus]
MYKIWVENLQESREIERKMSLSVLIERESCHITVGDVTGVFIGCQKRTVAQVCRSDGKLIGWPSDRMVIRTDDHSIE